MFTIPIPNFQPGLEIISERQNDRESTYCQALLYEQRPQKIILTELIDLDELISIQAEMKVFKENFQVWLMGDLIN